MTKLHAVLPSTEVSLLIQVTWQFLSLHCLEHPNLPVTIPDELESFLHVLVYNATRFLRHNIDPISYLISSYFDGYSQENGQYFSPEDKRSCIMEFKGEKLLTKYHKKGLIFSRSDGSEKHPLNIILKLLYQMFQARYIVEDYEKELKEREKNKQEAKKRKEEELRRKALLAAQLVKSKGLGEDSDDDIMDVHPTSPIRVPARPALKRAPGEPPAPSEPPLEPPSEMTTKLMGECRLHAFFRYYLSQWADAHDSEDIDEYGWDRNDKLDVDRLKHYVQSERKLVTNDPTERPTKSARTDHEMPKALKLPLDGRTA